MTCPNCEQASLWHLWGGYTASCRDCQTRELAASPQFFDCRQLRRITPEYKAMLQRIWGDDWRTGHAQVKALAVTQGATL